MPLTRRRFLALAAALAAAACTKTARHAAIPRGGTVLALGDSLTYGYGASAGRWSTAACRATPPRRLWRVCPI